MLGQEKDNMSSWDNKPYFHEKTVLQFRVITDNEMEV